LASITEIATDAAAAVIDKMMVTTTQSYKTLHAMALLVAIVLWLLPLMPALVGVVLITPVFVRVYQITSRHFAYRIGMDRLVWLVARVTFAVGPAQIRMVSDRMRTAHHGNGNAFISGPRGHPAVLVRHDATMAAPRSKIAPVTRAHRRSAPRRVPRPTGVPVTPCP